MPQGGVTVAITPGGGQQAANGQQQARQLALLGVSPGGTINTLYQPGNTPAAQALCDTGPLLEEAALVFAASAARPAPYLVPLNQGSAGAVSGAAGLMVAGAANQGSATLNVTVAPHRAIRVKVTLGGVLGTAKVRVSLDGGVTYQAEQTTAAGWATTGYAVPGTFVTIKLSAATYVLNDFGTVGVDGTITNFASAGILTFTASPIDQYELLATVTKGGANGSSYLSVSLDNGVSVVGNFFVPSSGIVVVTDGHSNGTGLVITVTGTTTTGDTYTGLALPPAPAQVDVTNGISAMIASPFRPTVCLLHIQAQASSVASAMALGQAVDAVLATAFASGLDWQAIIECPVVGDVVMSGGAPILDAADTDAAIRTARTGVSLNRVAVCGTQGGIVSPITSVKTRRPFGWALTQRYVQTDPANSLGRPADGQLNFTIGARDEKLSAIQLGDVQINVPTTYDGYPGCYLNITANGFAFKNLNTSALYQDAEGMRALNVMSAALRVAGMSVLADRPPVNQDNTIAEGPAKDYDTKMSGVAKRSLGLLAGGAFGNQQQASFADASVDRTSVLGASPRTLKIIAPFKGLGMISAVAITIPVQGA